MPNLPGQQPTPAETSTHQNLNSNIVYTADNKMLRVTEGEYSPTDDRTKQESSSSEKASREPTTQTTPSIIGDPSPKQELNAKINILLIPSIVILSSLLISAIIAYLFRKKLCKKRHKISKDDLVSNFILLE